FNEIIQAQGGSLKKLRDSKFQRDLFTQKSGKIIEIDNKKVNSLARIAGCPIDKFAGLYFHKKSGDFVLKGEKIITIYADSLSRLHSAFNYYMKEKPVKIR
ncbi:MAG: thymidine phosphorylase, partial [Candidatus Pacearchaeota archaeon]